MYYYIPDFAISETSILSRVGSNSVSKELLTHYPSLRVASPLILRISGEIRVLLTLLPLIVEVSFPIMGSWVTNSLE